MREMSRKARAFLLGEVLSLAVATFGVTFALVTANGSPGLGARKAFGDRAESLLVELNEAVAA
jgi:hypothetical protein